VLAAQGGDVSGWFDAQLVLAEERHASRQAHDLVPAPGRLGRVHVKDDDDAALPIGRRRRRVDTAGAERAKVEIGVRRDHELLPGRVIVAQKRLPTAHVAEEEEDVPLADGPKVGTGPIVPF